MEWLALLMFAVVCAVLLLGYPVALSLAGTALVFAGIGVSLDLFSLKMLFALSGRLYGVMTNPVLLAVPLFVFMGVMLERAKIAESLLESMASLFGNFRAGMAVSVTIVGMLLAASTGIVGATVVTMGLLSLPVMLKNGYQPSLATGTICASGTLGQIIPPSIVLVLLGDTISSAYRDSQIAGDPVSVGDLFAGALIPGLGLVVLYLLYLSYLALFKGDALPALDKIKNDEQKKQIHWIQALKAMFFPLVLIFLVLGSILLGYASPTEAAGVGAAGAILLAALRKELTLARLKDVMLSTTKTSSMVFLILIGASVFSLVFKAFDGDTFIQQVFAGMPGGVTGAIIIVMVMIFLLGFILDFIEITFVVVPIVAPILLKMGVDPVWLGVMIAINLQTSFLTPPFGFALFYLRGVAPPEVKTESIYRGVMPFIGLQILMLILLAIWPQLATGLPKLIYG